MKLSNSTNISLDLLTELSLDPGYNTDNAGYVYLAETRILQQNQSLTLFLKQYRKENTTLDPKLHLSIQLQENSTLLSSLRKIYEEISKLHINHIQNILSWYAPQDTIKEITKLADIKELAALLLCIEERYKAYGEPSLGYIIDHETGKPQLTAIILPNCNWESWGKIAKEVKNEIKKAGLKNLASKVAIICLEGLQEPKP